MSEETTPVAAVDNTASATTEVKAQEISTPVETPTEVTEVAPVEVKAEVKPAEVVAETTETKTDVVEEKPIEYTDFTLPEGFEKDQGLQDAVIPVLKDLKLPQAEAQKLVDTFSEVQKVKVAEAQKAFTEQIKVWTDAKEADPEFKAKKALAEKGIARLTTDIPELAEIFGDELWGNKPEFYKLAQYIGTHMESEASALGGTDGASKPNMLEAMYGTSMK